MIDISPDFGTPNSRARDINDNGQATGWMGSNVNTNGTAFVWQNGQVTELPVIPGGFMSEGMALDNQGHVAGYGSLMNPQTNALEYHAFIWNGARILDIGTLSGFIWSGALGINDYHAVVGKSYNSGGNFNISRGFIWHNGAMSDLNHLIQPNPGITIDAAWDINNAGQITATAKMPGGALVAVLLTPEAARLGDLDGDCTVGILDFLSLLAAWGPCPPTGGCAADLDSDGNVSIIDFLTLLANWG